MRFVLLFSFISLFFWQCNNRESDDSAEISKIQTPDISAANSLYKVDVALMYRFEDEEFPERVKNLFSSYYSAVVQGQNTTNFYDERSVDFMRFPETTQNIREFYEPDFFKKHKPMIIAVYPQGQDTIVKLNFIRVDSVGVATNMATVNFGVTEQDGYLFLTNMVLLNSKDWLETEFGNIKYIYPPTHHFSQEKATKMENFNRQMASLFETEPMQFRCFITRSNIEMDRLQGFDYKFNMFNMDTTGGLAAVYSKIIYSGNGTEYYPHELVHLYTKQWLGKENSKPNDWFNEGIATFLGGSRGKPLEWHLKVLRNYLDTNPDLSEMFDDKQKIGNSTNLSYAIGGLVCKLAYEKGGMTALKELMTAGTSNENFYEAVEKVLGVPKEDFRDFVYRNLPKNAA